MAFAHSDFNSPVVDQPKGRFHLDLSFARHFVGLFALTFSVGVLALIAHFVFKI